MYILCEKGAILKIYVLGTRLHLAESFRNRYTTKVISSVNVNVYSVQPVALELMNA